MNECQKGVSRRTVLVAAAVSEQALAQQAMDALAPGSMVVGDRNFGVSRSCGRHSSAVLVWWCG